MTFGSDSHENELFILSEIWFKVRMFSPLQHSSLVMSFTVVQGKELWAEAWKRYMITQPRCSLRGKVINPQENINKTDVVEGINYLSIHLKNKALRPGFCLLFSLTIQEVMVFLYYKEQLCCYSWILHFYCLDKNSRGLRTGAEKLLIKFKGNYKDQYNPQHNFNI